LPKHGFLDLRFIAVQRALLGREKITGNSLVLLVSFDLASEELWVLFLLGCLNRDLPQLGQVEAVERPSFSRIFIFSQLLHLRLVQSLRHQLVRFFRLVWLGGFAVLFLDDPVVDEVEVKLLSHKQLPEHLNDLLIVRPFLELEVARVGQQVPKLLREAISELFD